MKDYLTSFFSWFPVIPAAALCYAPMKNRMKFKSRRAYAIMFAALLAFMLAGAYFDWRFSLSYNALLPLIFIVCFTVYHLSLTVSIEKSLAIFAVVSALMSYLANFAIGCDAVMHPNSTLNNFSFEAAIYQSVLSCVVGAILYFPVSRYGSRLIDHFNNRKVWFIMLPVSGILFTINMLMSPRKYETLHVNLIFLTFWVLLVLLLTLLLLLCVLFYFIVSGMMDAARTSERNRILEMQESHYIALQRYMDETAKVRHDFRHTIGALEALAEEGDMQAIRRFIDEYIQAMPQNETVHFCDNHAFNAMLNYYLQMARASSIQTEWDVVLPADIKVNDTDLCGIIGNILENAITACENVQIEERFIDLDVRVESGDSLFIVASNSFDGNVKQKNGRYLSTKRNGTGIGLKSILSTVEKYGGTASFSHEGNEFYTDIVLPA